MTGVAGRLDPRLSEMTGAGAAVGQTAGLNPRAGDSSRPRTSLPSVCFPVATPR